MQKKNPSNSTNELMRYAGLTSQILVSLAIAVFIGYKLDKWVHMPIPLLLWLLPLLVLVMMIYKLIKETSKAKPDDRKKQV